MPALKDKLLKMWNEEDTKERCGFILKNNVVLEVENTHPQPEFGFEICAKDIVENEDKLKGTWHTHPNSNAILSHEDYTCFLNWPKLEHYILGQNGIRRYVVKDGVLQNDS